MTHERQHQSVFNRLRHSRTARAAALVLTLAGCGTSAAPSSANHAPGQPKATPVAVGIRTPGPTASAKSSPRPSRSPKPTESSRPPAAHGMPMAEQCRADSKILNTAFQLGLLSVTEHDCTLQAEENTWGTPVMQWTISGGSLAVSVDKLPPLFKGVFTAFRGGHGNVAYTVGGDEAVIDNSAQIKSYVKLGDGTYGEIDVSGPSVTAANTDQALQQASALLLNLNNVNPYSTQPAQ